MRLVPAALVAALLAVPAAAQTPPPNCADREATLAMLAERYGEQKVGIGLDNRGPIIEVYANPETGTWTALSTPPGSALSCIVGAGEGWHTLTLRPQPPGDPT